MRFGRPTIGVTTPLQAAVYCLFTFQFMLVASARVLSDVEGAHLQCGGNPAPGVGKLDCRVTLPIPRTRSIDDSSSDATEPISTREICIPANKGAGKRCIQGSVVWIENMQDEDETDTADGGDDASHLSCGDVNSLDDTERLKCTATIHVPDIGKVDDTKPITCEICNNKKNSGRKRSAVTKEQCLQVSISWRAMEPEVEEESDGEESSTRIEESISLSIPMETSYDGDSEEISDQSACSAEEGTCSSNNAASERDQAKSPSSSISLPVKLDKETNADHSTLLVGQQAYIYPYSQYGKLVSPTLTRMKRELLLGEVTKSEGWDDQQEFFEHIVALANLCSELGITHVQNMIDAQEGRVISRPLAEEHRRGVAAHEVTLELYRIAATFLDDENDLLEFVGRKNGLLAMLAATAAILLQLAEMMLADPELADDEVDVVPFYNRALRYTRQSIAVYNHAVEVLEEMVGPEYATAHDGQELNNGNELATIELGISDASVRLGNLILEMYDQDMVDVILDTSRETIDERSVHLETPVPDKGDDDSPPSALFGVNEERVLKQARESFERAASGYRRFGREDAEDHTLLADALHAIGIVSLYLSDLPRSIEVWEESLEIYSDLESRGVVVDKDFTLTLAETLLSLSDALLQSGRYDDAMHKYREAMHRYAEMPSGLSRPQPPHRLKHTQFEDDESVNIHEEALEQYYQSIKGGAEVPVDYEFDPSSQVDELYEGDLLATLGSIYLSRNEPTDALGYLSKAIQLYEDYLEDDELALADALLNKAYALFYLGSFDESLEAYKDAVEVYRAIPADANPLSSGEDLGTSSTNDESANIRQRLINLDDYRLGLQNMTRDRM